MSNKVTTLKLSKLEKWLLKNGYEKTSQEGSHVTFLHRTVSAELANLVSEVKNDSLNPKVWKIVHDTIYNTYKVIVPLPHWKTKKELHKGQVLRLAKKFRNEINMREKVQLNTRDILDEFRD